MISVYYTKINEYLCEITTKIKTIPWGTYEFMKKQSYKISRYIQSLPELTGPLNAKKNKIQSSHL